MNTYVVEGGVGKCTAFSALIPEAKNRNPKYKFILRTLGALQITLMLKLVLEQSLPIQDARIMASDNIYYSEPYKSNFQFGKQHIIESYCELAQCRI
jgi:hypothetical protein